MGRKRTRIHLTEADRAAITHLLKAAPEAHCRERLNFAIQAATGKHTLEELAQLTDRSRSTIQNWLGRFERGGLVGLTSRAVAPGRISPVAGAKIQAELKRGLKCKRWATAQEIVDWLGHQHGIKRSRKSIYYWLRKLGSGSA